MKTDDFQPTIEDVVVAEDITKRAREEAERQRAESFRSFMAEKPSDLTLSLREIAMLVLAHAAGFQYGYNAGLAAARKGLEEWSEYRPKLAPLVPETETTP